MGGEKQEKEEVERNELGSPPRGRGKGLRLIAFVFRAGITPAWAGKRYKVPKIIVEGKDHPRVGGEKTKKIP